MHLYIALYSRGTHFQGSFYWALVPSDSPSAPLGFVTSYQILELAGRWTALHEIIDLTRSENFLGCVRLPSIPDASASDLASFIEQYDAEQGDYRTTGSVRWSCARWIIQILEDLIDSGLMSLDMNRDNFYQRIVARGTKIEGLLKRITPCPMLVLDY